MVLMTFTDTEKKIAEEALAWLDENTWHHYGLSPYFKDKDGNTLGFVAAEMHPDSVGTTCAKGALMLGTWRLGKGHDDFWNLSEKIDHVSYNRFGRSLSGFSDSEAEHVDEVKERIAEIVLR
jgi:hypothetical protein